MNNEEPVYIKLFLSFYSRKEHIFFFSLKDRWRDIYSKRGLLLVPYQLPGATGCQRLHPFESRIVRDVRDDSDRVPIPVSTLDSDWTLSKSDHVVLYITWSPSGYTLVQPVTPMHCLPSVY